MFDLKAYGRLRATVLCISLIAWAVLLSRDNTCQCGAVASGASCPSTDSPAAMAEHWMLMLVAMMLPMLIRPMYFIWLSSLARKRWLLLTLFVAGYFAVWMVGGAVLMVLVEQVENWLPSSFFPALVLAMVALVWQASPIKQVFLNKCHRHQQIAAFGTAAVRDATRTGLEHGIWCIGSCWALMLFPLLLTSGHEAAMLFVTLLMISERLDPASEPRWKLRGLRYAFLWSRWRIDLYRSSQRRTGPTIQA